MTPTAISKKNKIKSMIFQYEEIKKFIIECFFNTLNIVLIKKIMQYTKLKQSAKIEILA